MKLFSMLLAASALAFTVNAADTDVKLAWPFTDHAVFQQGMYVPIWGKAAPHAAINAQFNGQTFSTNAAASGEFTLRLSPQTAGGPFTLSVSANHGEPVVISDVMVGEVWLAGGQSNMQYQLNSDWSSHRNEPLEQRKNNVNYRQFQEYLDTTTPQNTIRGLRVPLKTVDCEETEILAKWEIMDTAHAGNLSAVGAWFGRNIQEATGVTVGIIACNWGGTPAEAWTSRAGLLSNPQTAPMVASRDLYETKERQDNFSAEKFKNDFLAKNHLADPGNKGFAQGWAKADFDDSAWKTMEIPGSWVQQKLMGNGALWVRRAFTIPEEWVGKELQLNLGPIDKHDVTYVNGVEVGRTGKDFEDQYWNVHRTYTVPAKLVTSTKVVIAIRAFSHYQDGSISGSAGEYQLSTAGTGTVIPLAGVWQALPEVDLGYHTYQLPPGVLPKQYRAAALYESMLHAVIPYGIRGAIWYQGESNAGSIASSKAYRRVMETMIRDWRYQWAQGDFPFIQTQLAAYQNPHSYSDTETWGFLRESQLKVCGDLPNVYLGTAIDIGEAGDIHPQNKKEVGRRLALVARKNVYGEKELTDFGPIFEKATPEGQALRLSFRNADGMEFKGGAAQGFYLAGEDKHFVKADKVVIDGETVVVSATSLAKPVAVRYAWSNNPDGNLYNAAGLPASSFRSDNW